MAYFGKKVFIKQLFARHHKLQEQSEDVKKSEFKIAICTPARIQQLVKILFCEQTF